MIDTFVDVVQVKLHDLTSMPSELLLPCRAVSINMSISPPAREMHPRWLFPVPYSPGAVRFIITFQD